MKVPSPKIYFHPWYDCTITEWKFEDRKVDFAHDRYWCWKQLSPDSGFWSENFGLKSAEADVFELSEKDSLDWLMTGEQPRSVIAIKAKRKRK